MEAFDIIIIAALAAFIFLRLRSELGNKSGSEPLPPAPEQLRPRDNDIDAYGRPVNPENDGNTVVDMEEDPKLRQVYQNIRRSNRAFAVPQFLAGAEAAYRMILEAFWKGDTATLQDLLSEDVYQQFTSAIDARADAGNEVDNRLIDIDNAEVVDGEVNDRIAELTVKFTSEIIAVTKNSDGDIVEGNASEAITVNDIWSFSKDTRSRDPKWMLVATRAG
jgi:predicted lipid-binding transport protein (Tim44 family)